MKPVRLLHTSDWHLGHELMGHSRESEHEAFLIWLLEALEEHKTDVLLVTGDVYDVANPPVSAMRRLYGFVREVQRRVPKIQIVIIGGNHDSALRIDLPGALLEEGRVRFVGGLPRKEREPDFDRICMPLENADGEVAAWLAAVPFCRPGDLGQGGLAELYGSIADAAAAKAGDLPLVLSGHLHVAGGEVSEMSERRIVVGGEEAQAASLFDSRAAYVALGHLHRPQTIRSDVPIRYAGSPFPLSATEREYRHSVSVVTLDSTGTRVEEVAVPRPVRFLKVPAGAPKPLNAVLAELESLKIEEELEERDRHPFLEVAVLVSGPEPHLQSRILAALDGKPVRLTRIIRERSIEGGSRALAARDQELTELKPESVFAELHRTQHGTDPAEALDKAFNELLIAAHCDDGEAV
jgi:exonuclease SbcD